MVDNRQNLGETGEAIASAFLENNGYTILTQNYRRKFGEIDIIAREGDSLVFIEVKTRTGVSHGHPLDAVTFKKQKQINYTRATLYWMGLKSILSTSLFLLFERLKSLIANLLEIKLAF